MKTAKYILFTVILLSNMHYSNGSNKRKFTQLTDKRYKAEKDNAEERINKKLQSMVNFEEVFKKATKITPNGKSTTFNIKNALDNIAKQISEKLTYRHYKEIENDTYKYVWSQIIHNEIEKYQNNKKQRQQENDNLALQPKTNNIISDIKNGAFERIYQEHNKSIKDVLIKHYKIDHEKYNTDKKQARNNGIKKSWALLLHAELERINEQDNPKKVCNASKEEIINYLNSKNFFNDYTTKKDQFEKFFIEKYNLKNNFFNWYKSNKKPWAQLLVKKIKELSPIIDPFKEKIDTFLNNILTNKCIENSLNYSSMQKFYTTFSFTESDVAILRKRLPQLWEEHPEKKVIYDKIWENINKNRKGKAAENVKTSLKNKNLKRNIHKNYLENNANINNVIIRTPIDFTDRYIRRPKYQSKNIKQSNNLIEMIEEKPIQNNDDNLKGNYSIMPPETQQAQIPVIQSNNQNQLGFNQKEFFTDENFSGNQQDKNYDPLWESLLN